MSEYIFKKLESPDENGDLLKFVGNFEALYSSQKDPWDQSSHTENGMQKFYQISRGEILHRLSKFSGDYCPEFVEIGCGHGYFSASLRDSFPAAKISGLDISPSAIKIARQVQACRNIDFFVADIINLSKVSFEEESKVKGLSGRCDAVILNQVLWYILKDIEDVVKNCQLFLRHNKRSTLIISQAFPRLQLFGKSEMDGFNGAVDFFKFLKGDLHLRAASMFDDLSLPHIDCHFELGFR